MHWRSLVAVSRGYSLAAVHGLLIAVASLVAEHRLSALRLQWVRLTGPRAEAQELWYTGLFAPWHVRSSLTKDRTHVPCVGRWMLTHCTTSEVHNLSLESKSSDGRIQLLFVVSPQVSSKTGVPE